MARLDAAEDKIRQYELRKTRHDRFAYRVSLLIISPLHKQEVPVVVDEYEFVESETEALEKEKESWGKQNEIKRGILICKQSTLRPVPF